MPSKSKSSRRLSEATMIRGSSVNIGYAKMNMTNHQNQEMSIERAERRYALDLLRSNCSLAALLDSNERYDPPRCAEATRRGILQKMEDWVLHDGPRDAKSSIFWLYGGAGVGKSALAQTLAETLKANDLAATFFFFKADVNRNDGNRLIPTLALQLLQSFPRVLITPFVEDKILADPDLFKKNRYTQMFELLVEPLKMLWFKEAQSTSERRLHPRLIVIDGLDECIDPNIQCDLLQIIASAIPHFPYPLRFLITSRPESHITRVFQHDLKEATRYNLSDDSNADEDIRNFLEGEFAKICRTHPLRGDLISQWPPSGSIGAIVERSSGHFIYASTVIRFIQSPRHRPDDRLQVVLGLKEPYEKDRPFAPLDLLYSLIFLEIQDLGQLEKIQCALGIMHLRSLKTGLFGWWQSTSDRRAIEVLLDLRPGDLVLLFDPLLSLLTFDNGDIRIFHKSLFDYLLDSTRSEDLALDLSSAHETAANYLLGGKKPWDSAQFDVFAYHCQFARLNDKLKGHLRSLAYDPKISFTEPLSKLLRPSSDHSLLQSTICFLQVICRKDFDSSGDCYKKYVIMNNRWLRSAVPLGQRLKCMISRLTIIRKSAYFERMLRLSFEVFPETLPLKDVQWKGAKGFNERIQIPCFDTSVINSIKQEHEMFSSYVKARHRYPHIVVSFLEASRDLIHSCHFVIQSVVSTVKFVMLVTYTENGVRLSCSVSNKVSISLRYLDDSESLRESIKSLMEKHRRMTKSGVDKMTVVYSTISLSNHNSNSLFSPRSTISNLPIP